MCARIASVFAVFPYFKDKSYFKCALAHGIVSIRRRGDGMADLSDVPPELPAGARLLACFKDKSCFECVLARFAVLL